MIYLINDECVLDTAPPNKVFLYTCNLIAENLQEFGCKFLKSKNEFCIKTKNSDFSFCFDTGTSSANVKGESVRIEVKHCCILSDKLASWRKEKYKDFMTFDSEIMAQMVTYLRDILYMNNPPIYKGLGWNVAKAQERNEFVGLVIALIKEHFIILLDRLNNDMENLLPDIAKHDFLIGKDPKNSMFNNNVDFLMCYGNKALATEGLQNFYNNMQFKQHKRDFKKGYEMLLQGVTSLQAAEQLYTKNMFIEDLQKMIFNQIEIEF